MNNSKKDRRRRAIFARLAAAGAVVGSGIAAHDVSSLVGRRVQRRSAQAFQKSRPRSRSAVMTEYTAYKQIANVAKNDPKLKDIKLIHAADEKLGPHMISPNPSGRRLLARYLRKIRSRRPFQELHEAKKLSKYPGKKYRVVVSATQGAGALAHELGHVKFQKSSVGRVINRLGHPALRGTGIAVSALAAQPLINRSNLSEKNKNRARVASAAIPLASFGAHMTEEISASMIGRTLMNQAKVSKIPRARALRAMTAGTISHAANFKIPVATAAMVGASYAVNKFLNRKKVKVRRTQ